MSNFEDKDDKGEVRDTSRIKKKKYVQKQRFCVFCKKGATVDYKDVDSLRMFITEQGKIKPRRATGTCDKHQRMLVKEIKKARTLAYIPFAKK